MTRTRALQDVTMLAVVALSWSAIGWLARQASPGDLPAIERAEFVAARGEAMPSSRAPWRAVALPDDWRERPGGLVEGWYRLRFTHDPNVPAGKSFVVATAMTGRALASGDWPP